jgi:phosphoglycolate phosphatase
MRYKAILFDMDGTLLDTLADMVSAVNHILSVHGWPQRTTEEVRAFVGNGARRLMERAVPPDVTGGAFEAVLAEYREWYQAHNCVDTAPYPGIPALLDALAAAGVKTAVVSNKPDRTTRTLAARFFPELDGAMGQREGIASKPAPDMVRAALDQLHAAPEETLYVGDSEVDVATARNAGLDMIGVAWGFRGRAALEAAGAPLVADTPEQLLDMLQ